MKQQKPKANFNRNRFLNINYKSLEKNEYIEKEINKDGNCFYRALSYYYRQTENDFDEYRQLIVNYIENDVEEYLIFIANEDLNDPNIVNDDKEIIFEKKNNIYLIIQKMPKKTKNGQDI